ncbi:MAG: aminotransferase class I/II-fold pyridoxal phosphate-dependent enzyme [Paludisphaera borealis]|uniref:trans-sulfuration enzyme family protein n=1 Tax=Paludisphaera borealis TaxID=1387353 RepID=UPI0028405C23|nr:aminotransferase class I/II-fold pyridoxal phosphate-dependent enzyme [Paludisphaera borealis]MDR3622307.1 aminotransferase class I/II-fold pyridoxal phosphate-dependent enzyme [Paludisphaera borealis]
MSSQEPVADSTLCARAPEIPPSASEPVAPNIALSSVYRVKNLDDIDALNEGRLSGFFYARDGHPNAVQLGDKLARLERAEAGVVCASGMAAVAASLLALLDQGDHVAISDGLYGKTTTLATRELSRFGVQHSAFDPTRLESLEAAITPRTRLIVAETVSNPLLRVCDVERVGEAARKAGVPFLIDHTFAPLLCRPLELGATIVVHSLTKLIGGHSDVTLGAALGPKSLIDRIKSVASTFGQTGGPFDSWLSLRGMATLSLRVERTSQTALELAHRLESHAKVRRVFYPGLASHPDADLVRRIFQRGFGAMITFDVGGRDQADRLIRSLREIPFAPSLGDVQTTLSHPCSTSHRGQDPAVLERLGITPGLVRLSVGLEDVNDLWDDLGQALHAL